MLATNRWTDGRTDTSSRRIKKSIPNIRHLVSVIRLSIIKREFCVSLPQIYKNHSFWRFELSALRMTFWDNNSSLFVKPFLSCFICVWFTLEILSNWKKDIQCEKVKKNYNICLLAFDIYFVRRRRIHSRIGCVCVRACACVCLCVCAHDQCMLVLVPFLY